MNTRKPKGEAMPDDHPPFGEVRSLECRAGHVVSTWWRPSSDQPFAPVGTPPAAGVDAGAPCPTCGLELDEAHTLIDGGLVDGDPRERSGQLKATQEEL